jgi:hypothetical protein
MDGPDAAVIAHVIQLSVAPVFLLSGVAALLGVMTGRLGRVLDRARRLEEMWKSLDEAAMRRGVVDLTVLTRRAHLASWAINACAAAGLLVCLVIAGLFIDAFLGTQLRWAVGFFFFSAMVALIAGLGFFLKEVYLATHTLRIGPPK